MVSVKIAINHPRVRNIDRINNMLIYKATNLINNKVYIGQTKNTLKCRANQHYRCAKCNTRPKYGKFYIDIMKYGINNFKFEVIEFVDNVETLDERERYWISFYKATDENYGYNIDNGGLKGNIKSVETRKRIGLTTIEKFKNEETRKRMIDGLRKGTEVFRKRCYEKRVEFICPVCGRKLYIRQFESKTKQVCSRECANIFYHDKSVENFKKATEIVLERKHQRNLKLKKLLHYWLSYNYSSVMTCPFNCIDPSFKSFLNIMKTKYNIIDWRTIVEIVDCKNKKSFLTYCKQYINENIC